MGCITLFLWLKCGHYYKWVCLFLEKYLKLAFEKENTHIHTLTLNCNW